MKRLVGILMLVGITEVFGIRPLLAQTTQGAIRFGVDGYVQHSSQNNETVYTITASPGYMATNWIEVGIGVGVSKTEGFARTTSMGGGVSCLFNTVPGKQKFIPRITAFGGGLWGGTGFKKETSSFYGGSVGMRYYLNRTVGLSANIFWERENSNQYRRGRDTWDNYGASWGVFLSFRSKSSVE